MLLSRNFVVSVHYNESAWMGALRKRTTWSSTNHLWCRLTLTVKLELINELIKMVKHNKKSTWLVDRSEGERERKRNHHPDSNTQFSYQNANRNGIKFLSWGLQRKIDYSSSFLWCMLWIVEEASKSYCCYTNVHYNVEDLFESKWIGMILYRQTAAVRSVKWLLLFFFF